MLVNVYFTRREAPEWGEWGSQLAPLHAEVVNFVPSKDPWEWPTQEAGNVVVIGVAVTAQGETEACASFPLERLGDFLVYVPQADIDEFCEQLNTEEIAHIGHA
jgi:hypothetical protein